MSGYGYNRKLHGIDLCGDNLYLLDNEKIQEENIISTPRINIDYAGEAKEYPWRFLIKDNKFISTSKTCKKAKSNKKVKLKS